MFAAARDFQWTVPAGHVVLLLAPAIVIVAANCRPARKSFTLCGAIWLLASLTIWAALLRAPLSVRPACYWPSASAGSSPMRSCCVLHPRRLRFITAALLGVLGVLAALSTGWDTVREYRAVAELPPVASSSRNVILIVWDTVRAYSTSPYGYFRDTTPNLRQWAKQGVQYDHALAPAPWTYPSHATFFTGQWPLRLNSQWKFKLDTPHPTLAEYLASRGYQTAGFAANTNCCSYESGLARGFQHFEDYSLAPWSLLSRTVPGKWLLENILTLGTWCDSRLGFSYTKKWVTLESRGAKDINEGFLGWLSGRRSDRPFFAFLNYFDAHEPFVPPPGFESRFGVRPTTPQDYQFLFDFVGTAKSEAGLMCLRMAVDCYDDCITFLDEQLGTLLKTLKAQGLLENTDVIITSDHGEAFGDHGIWGHSYTVNLDEVGVPLVILSQLRTRRHEGELRGDPARLAGDSGRPARSRGRLTVPRPIAGRLLESVRCRTGCPAGNHHPRVLRTGRSHRA